MPEKRRRRRRRRSRRRRSMRRMMLTMSIMTQRVKSAIYTKVTELIPSVKGVRVTTSRTAPVTSPSTKRTRTTMSQMLRMMMKNRTSLIMMKSQMMTLKVTWKTI